MSIVLTLLENENLSECPQTNDWMELKLGEGCCRVQDEGMRLENGFDNDPNQTGVHHYSRVADFV